MLNLEEAVSVHLLQLKILRLYKERIKKEIETLKSKLDPKYKPKIDTNIESLEEEINKANKELAKFDGKGFLRKDLAADAIISEFTDRLGFDTKINPKGIKEIKTYWTWVQNNEEFKYFERRSGELYSLRFHKLRNKLILKIEFLNAKKQRLIRKYRKHKQRMVEKDKLTVNLYDAATGNDFSC